jgi:hypothetical protein
VGDLSQLLTAITGLVGAISGFTGLIWGIARTLRKEPRKAAKTGAQKYAEEIAAAAADGVLTADEIDAARRHLDEEEEGDRP